MKGSTYEAVTQAIDKSADPVVARNRARFFKTGAGQYGEGDLFRGLTVPAQRAVAKQHLDLPLSDITRLLRSPYHEYRFVALVVLVERFRRAPKSPKQALVDFYLAHAPYVNNWDLVDASAPYILGEHLKEAGDDLLDKLAQSEDLWTRRIAIVATLSIIRSGKTEPTLRIAELLFEDTHDLIHKAVGWALREVGRVDRAALLGFLQIHYARLPRTALRYAIEHLSPEARKAALSGIF